MHFKNPIFHATAYFGQQYFFAKVSLSFDIFLLCSGGLVCNSVALENSWQGLIAGSFTVHGHKHLICHNVVVAFAFAAAAAVVHVIAIGVVLALRAAAAALLPCCCCCCCWYY